MASSSETTTYTYNGKALREVPPRLVEVEAPRIPDRTTALSRPPAGLVFKKLGAGLALIGIAILVFWWFPLIGPIAAVYLLYKAVRLLHSALKGQIAPCPFCGTLLGNTKWVSDLTMTGKAKPVRCEACGEYNTLQNGQLRPHDPTAVADKPTFKSPAFKDSVWPNGCVACGAPPARFDIPVFGSGFRQAALFKGLFTFGGLPQVPYCQEHREKLRMEADRNERLSFVWCSLPMMRRYLAANRTYNEANWKLHLGGPATPLFCNSCGAEVLAGTPSCVACGAQISNPAPPH